MRILIILKYCYIGDALVSIPLIKGIRRQWPGAEVTVLTSQGAAKLLPLDPELAACRFVPYGPRGTSRSVLDSIQLTMQMLRYAWQARRNGGFDIVFAVHRGARVNLTSWLAGGRERLGFTGFLFSSLLTKKAAYVEDRQESESTLSLLKLLAPDHNGEPWPDRPVLQTGPPFPPPAVPFPPPGDGPLIGMQPGASSPTKRWPLDRVAALANHLTAHHGARIVLIGGPDEREPADAVIRQLTIPPACDATGERLPETAGIMARLTLFIGNDTGLNHLAAASGCPTVCFFGTTPAGKWGRHYHPHRMVVSPDRTMEGVTLEAAIAAVEELLAALQSPRG